MTEPTVVEISHNLGREEARRRIASRIGELASYLPGSVADVKTSWPSEDRAAIQVSAMGQQVPATIDIEERVLRVTFVLPGMLGFFSGAIAGAIRDKGGKLLLPDH